jgi:hypothetical protein
MLNQRSLLIFVVHKVAEVITTTVISTVELVALGAK